MTDVEASTEAWNRSHDATEAAMRALDADIADHRRRNDGSLIKARGEGDSHFAVFSLASHAVAAPRPRSSADPTSASRVRAARARRRGRAARRRLPGRRRQPRRPGPVRRPRRAGGRHPGGRRRGHRLASPTIWLPVASACTGCVTSPTRSSCSSCAGRACATSFPPLHTTAYTSHDDDGRGRGRRGRREPRFAERDEELVAWHATLIRSLRRPQRPPRRALPQAPR